MVVRRGGGLDWMWWVWLERGLDRRFPLRWTISSTTKDGCFFYLWKKRPDTNLMGWWGEDQKEKVGRRKKRSERMALDPIFGFVGWVGDEGIDPLHSTPCPIENEEKKG